MANSGKARPAAYTSGNPEEHHDEERKKRTVPEARETHKRTYGEGTNDS